MATLTSSVNSVIPSTADLRKASIDQHRAKNRKVRYRNVNMNMMGVPIYPFQAETNPNCQKWNDHNKFKMPNPNTQGGACCRCASCRTARWESNTRNKARASRWEREVDDGSDDAAFDNDNVFRDGVDGVIYSYDRPSGPSQGSQVLTQALDLAIVRMEKKQLDTLIKTEYDVIYSEESASSEDDEYEFI